MPEQTPTEAREAGNGEIEYGPHYFRHDCGVPYERSDHWLEFFDRIAETIVRDLQPASVLDAGCAMGFLVEALRKRGVEAWGIDISEFAISQVDESVREYCSVASLTDRLPRRYDLIVSIEVLEHLPPAKTDGAIANLCSATDRLLFSTTPTDYGEATHLNVQPPEAWSALLAREGFLREVERDASYVTPWAAHYVRADETLPETVRRYDRSWWQLRQEADELRGSLLANQGRLAELEEKAAAAPAELQAELDRRQEEILRLRDLLIVKDIELGDAEGGIAELTYHSARFALAARSLQTHVRAPANAVKRVAKRLLSRRS